MEEDKHAQTVPTHHTLYYSSIEHAATTPPAQLPAARRCTGPAGRNLPVAGATSIAAPHRPAAAKHRHRVAACTRRRSLRCQPLTLSSAAGAPALPPRPRRCHTRII
eukprot:scaffold8434_cov112-Isochrysis_galbana.AAC.1